MKSKAVVVKNPDDPVPFEVMEKTIVQIGDAMSKLSKTRVTRKLLEALIKDQTGISKNVICHVLDSYESLEQTYLKRK